MSRIPRCVLHIGAEKTGTTAIQSALVNQSEELRRHGILYPGSLRSGRVVSHTRLVSYAADAHRVDDLRRWARATTPERVAAHRESVERDLTEELVASGEVPGMLLLSSEHCQSRLRSFGEILVLRGLLEWFCDEVTVILYLRPQHEAALSLYSTRLKAGLPARDPLSEPVQPGFLDYGALTQRWAAVFGEENLRVRTYEKHVLTGGTVLGDFAGTAGLPITLHPAPRPANPSLSPQGLRLLGAVNTVLPRFVLGRPNPVRPPLTRAVEHLFRGDGPVVGRAEAEEFYSRYAATNDTVRRRFFPDRQSLFTPDFTTFAA